jgi:hypothetical protein
MKKSFLSLLSLAAWMVFCALPAAASQAAYCEVVNVSGDAKLVRAGQAESALEKGDMILKGDRLIVGKDSWLDLAFDSEWKNTTRLSENTRALIRWLDPVRIEILGQGDIYAKLDALPPKSTFEVATPAAVASVRGTKYRTIHSNGETTVFNDSEKSLVYVYRLDEHGNRSGKAIVLKPGESGKVKGPVDIEETMPEDLQELLDQEAQDGLSQDLQSRTQQSSDEETSQTIEGSDL